MFIAEDKGTVIHCIQKENYSAWLSGQNEFVKNWLNQSGYKGSGTTLVPNNQGELDFVLLCADSLNDYFIAGDLPSKLPDGCFRLDCDDALQLKVAFSWGLGSYKYSKYKLNDQTKPVLAIPNENIRQRALNLIEAISLVRDLVNTPAADMMPEDLSFVADELAASYNAKVEHIIGEALIEKNFPMIHAVGRASCHAPRLIDLTWGDINHPAIVLIGKGICFDSGGLDIKPSSGMRLMKKDMGGAAHALGLARLIMSENLPVNLRVLIPAAENAISGNSFRPGDVIKSRSGLQVEIDNTDAEGRLVLCDALSYACENTPNLVIDFATLTGACRVALGTELPGFFTDYNDLAQSLLVAGESISDPVWQLPLYKPYKDMLKSEIADMVNSAPSGLGGAITAALYLQEFVAKEVPWMHFDLMAWNNRKLPGRPVGGEAFGIRAVFEMLNSRYGKESE